MNKIDKLFLILNTVENVTTTHFEKTNILDVLSQCNVLEKSWCNMQKDYDWKELDLNDIKNWITYENCIDYIFMLYSSSLICEITVFEGDNYYGTKTTRRFTAKIELPKEFILKIENLLNDRFNIYLNKKYEEFLQQEKNKWIDQYKDKFFKNN